MVTGTGSPPKGNALPRTEVNSEEGSVKLPSQVSQSWKQNIFQKKMWKGISSVGSKLISSIDYVDNTMCSTLGVGNNRNNAKNVPRGTFSEGFIQSQNTYENTNDTTDGDEEAKEQKEIKEEKSELEQELENESEETEKEGYNEQKNKEKEDKKDRQNKENSKSRENKENNNVEEKESNDRNYSQTDENELHELHALNTITNSPSNHTGSTVTKRGSLRLSFEAAMSLRRRNLSLKEQNLTVC